jgi:glycosyltransferase involved in cell wall biosynthesis
MNAPLVSIVIPNYNLARFVGEAITSALAQTHPAVEVVIVDDGSTDNSVEVIEEHLARCEPDARARARLIRRTNGGVCHARNDGAAAARGEYLVFFDADDVLEPTYVARCLEALLASPPSVGYAYTKMRLFGRENMIFEARPFDASRLLVQNFVHVAALMRRRHFDEVGGWNPAWSVGYEDHELWVRLLSHGYEGVFVPEPLLRYRRHGPSRNDLPPAKARQIHWKLMISYPRLCWRTIARHPLHAIRAVIRERSGGP